MDDMSQTSMLESTQPPEDSPTEGGCMTCGSVDGLIAAGSTEKGYQCSECYWQGYSKEDRIEEVLR